MPVVSKYTNKQVDEIINEVVGVLQRHDAPVDLALMVLGNAATDVINQLQPVQRKAIAEKFSQALMSSVETD